MKLTTAAGLTVGALVLAVGGSVATASPSAQPVHPPSHSLNTYLAAERVAQADRADRSRREAIERNHAAEVRARKAIRAAKAKKAAAERRAQEARAAAARAAQKKAAAKPAPRKTFSGGAGYTGMAVRVARCESGGDPNAQNPSSSASGLYQFIDGTWSSVTGLAAPASAYSVETQTAAFWKLWDNGRGSGHWAPSQYCWG